MPVLYLTEDDVRNVLTMEMALEAVEVGLKKVALDEAVNNPRSRCQTDHAMLHIMSAAGKTLGVLGFKAYITHKSGARFHFHLFDGRTGEHLAWMQADYLGQVRTGAASGVATKYMARPDCTRFGIFGSGKQARTQVQAICKVRPISRVHVFSPNEERRRAFAREMSSLYKTEVVPVPRPEEAARNMDIVVTATSSREPILFGDWLGQGTHLNIIGSNFLGKAEVDMQTVRRCKKIVVDSKDQARLEAGDLRPAVEEGVLHWAEVQELGQVVAGRFRGREHPEDITMFKSLGVAIEDVATAATVYAKAKEMGIGRILEI
ncbi:MAG TPA: ornithine cyclodeaminase family protein [Gemmataceae bacterium]|nr:ornithine cyclodeaminase family protein [Gemmataceae bacterium]